MSGDFEDERTPGRRFGFETNAYQESLVRSYLSSAADGSSMEELPAAGTPAGTVVVRAVGLRVRGMTVTAVNAVPSAGEAAAFCRPVVTAPAVLRRDGTAVQIGRASCRERV